MINPWNSPPQDTVEAGGVPDFKPSLQDYVNTVVFDLISLGRTQSHSSLDEIKAYMFWCRAEA